MMSTTFFPTLSNLCCDDSSGYAIIWFASTIVYFVSLHFTEQWQRRRKPQPQLHDVGFEYLPRVDFFVYVTDGIGIVGSAQLAKYLFLMGGVEALAVKEGLCYSAMGYFFSATLHSVTLFPSTDHAAGIPGFGNHADKLMSNHTFHFGLFLRVLVQLEGFPVSAVIPCMLIYSALLVCTRGHYSVDIVLSWWALALVYSLEPMSMQTCLAETK